MKNTSHAEAAAVVFAHAKAWDTTVVDKVAVSVLFK
jgi:hypothetical protein